MLGPFTTANRRTPHYHSPGVAIVVSHAACASMSTTTTTTMRDRRDRYGPMQWVQQVAIVTVMIARTARPLNCICQMAPYEDISHT